MIVPYLLGLYLLGVFVAGLPATAHGQDVIWERDGNTLGEFVKTDESTSEFERAEMIRALFAQLLPRVGRHDTLYVSGEADFGNRFAMRLPECNYVSDGAVWKHHLRIDETPDKPGGAPGFVLGRYAKFTGFHFVFRCHVRNEDGGGIGWIDDTNAAVIFENCDFDAAEDCDWPFYNWTKGIKHITVKGGTFRFCRFAFALCGTGLRAQTIDIDGMKFFGDAAGSRTYGASSSGNPETGGVLVPVLIRGGSVTMRNCTSQTVGLKQQYDIRKLPSERKRWGCPRVVGLVTDYFHEITTRCTIIVENCRSEVTPNLATSWYDIEPRWSNLSLEGGHGSLKDGEFKVWRPE